MAERHDSITHLYCSFSWFNLMHVLCITFVSACIQQLVMSSKFCFTEDIHYFWLIESFSSFFPSNCDKISTRTTSKNEGFTFSSLFCKVKSIVTGPLMLELKPKVEGIGGEGECFSFTQSGSREPHRKEPQKT